MEDNNSTSHLGKRKRTATPEATHPPANAKQPSLQTSLKDTLLSIRKHDTTPSLLKFPIPTSNSEAPDVKRARLANIESTNETIEEKILAGTYTSFDALKQDVNVVKAALLNDVSSSNTNGDSDGHSLSNIEEQLDEVFHVLSKCEGGNNKHANGVKVKTETEELAKAIPITPAPKHVITLRSYLPGVTPAHSTSSVLFSGLELNQQNDDVDESILPNGIQLTDFTVVGTTESKPKRTTKVFGEFARPPNQYAKLQPPQPSSNRTFGTTSLSFTPYLPRTNTNLPIHGDFKLTNLSTGSWLSYGAGGARDKSQIKGKQEESEAGDALFTSAYSSFAPNKDNSTVRGYLIPEQDRSRYWWHKYGRHKMNRIFKEQDSEELVSSDVVAEDEFADMPGVIDNFQPEPLEDARDEIEDADALLEEISGLIETLSSYQRNRMLELKVNPTNPYSVNLPQPSEAEFDVFEMLRDQLKILISSLPPFAVAKLNGDQLEDLNISTKILVEPADQPGTGRSTVEDWRPQVGRQPVAAPPARPAVPQGIPRAYPQGNATQTPYNTQARAYNASAPAIPSYGMRTTTTPNYQTPAAPRPTYASTPYQASNTPYNNRATIQQVQRNMQNGYGNYSAGPAAAVQTQTPAYGPRPSQPGYPQRPPQENPLSIAGRSASPQKPLANGQSYPPRPYPGQPQTPYQLPRQPSGGTPGLPSATPIPAGPAVASYGRYSNTPDRASSEASASAAAVAAGTAGQTVEVSR
ncbi:hypothetical protein PV08_10634 [Exophiala spinifera]|uniref:Uncharacterized protein n=1 Tax=Exophiala spinifera TaxID=91928 RepID=A0A0D2BJ04_9EURO|nr:uncharacterized protein PV08_10634 [Exophiala spinifera]KIW11334.1 hypothetical protein PV08_10634 [Exophiala spinifera]